MEYPFNQAKNILWFQFLKCVSNHRHTFPHSSVSRAGFTAFLACFSPITPVSLHSTPIKKFVKESEEDALSIRCGLNSGWRWHPDTQAKQWRWNKIFYKQKCTFRVELSIFSLCQEPIGSDSLVFGCCQKLLVVKHKEDFQNEGNLGESW